MAASAASLAYVQKMFLAYFGRPVAPSGQEYYAGLVDAGNVAALQDDFWNSTESQTKFASLSTEDKVSAIFQQLFGRGPLVEGLTYWTAQINSGAVSLPVAALTILNSAAGDDLTVFNAKLSVADAFTAQLDTAAEVTGLQNNLSGAVDVLAGIKTTAAATAAIADIVNIVNGVVTGGTGGQSFTLTTGTSPDVPTLTSGNDTITGATDSLKTGDVLADPSATDNDSVTVAITGGATNNKPVVSNIETVNLDFKGFGVIYDAASTTNATIIASSSQEGNSTATLYNVGAATKIQAGSGITTVNLESSATTLKLTGGQAITVNNKATAGTLALTSNGSSANTVTYDAAAGSKALAVSGSTALTIKTADVTADFSGNTVTNSLSGGAELTLQVTAAGTGATDLSKVAVSSIDLNVAATQSLTLASGSKVKLSKDIGTSTIALTTDGTADVLNLTVSASQTGAPLTLTNFETINLAIGTSAPASIAALTATTATNANNINLTGSQNTTIVALTGSATGTTLDASGLNGILTATGGTIAVTVVGGASNDVITGGATVADLLVGGAGNDTLTTGATAGDTIADTIIGGAGNDTIVWSSANVSIGAALASGGDGTDNLSYLSSVADTLTGKIVAVESVTATNTVGAITWVTADSDITAGSTLVFTVAGGASTGVLTLNAAAETDAYLNLAITNNSANVITGGALADSITLLSNAKANTITPGKGADTVSVSGATATVVFAAGDSGVTLATADVINGADAGEVLKFTSITTTVATSAVATSAQMGTGWAVDSGTGLATKTGATVDDFLSAAVASAKAGATGMNGQAVAFISGADTYVFYAGTDASGNTDDGLVKLTGLVITDLSATYGAAGTFTLG